MLFLGKYDNLNLQRINNSQYNLLVSKGYITPQNTQRWGEYVPNAVCFQDWTGQWRIKKVTKMMFELGLWKENNRRKYNYIRPENNTQEMFNVQDVTVDETVSE